MDNKLSSKQLLERSISVFCEYSTIINEKEQTLSLDQVRQIYKDIKAYETLKDILKIRLLSRYETTQGVHNEPIKYTYIEITINGKKLLYLISHELFDELKSSSMLECYEIPLNKSLKSI